MTHSLTVAKRQSVLVLSHRVEITKQTSAKLHLGNPDWMMPWAMPLAECHHAPAQTYKKIIDAYPVRSRAIAYAKSQRRAG
jgi:hypothetical protein